MPELEPLIDLTSGDIRVYDVKNQRMMPESRVKQGKAAFGNGSSIQLQDMPGFLNPDRDEADAILNTNLLNGEIVQPYLIFCW